ncbi:MAG: ribosomal protein S18-alanine N-acetyltransferase [Gammaproteobacteria bacterium]
MDTNRKIRRMVGEDVDIAYDIQCISSICPWPKNIVESACNQFEGYVVELDGKIVGVSFLFSQFEEAHLLNIAMLPQYQGMGLGRQMMEFLLDRARSLGAILMILEVRPSNCPAIALYESMGFIKIGERKDYYELPNSSTEREDAWVFSKRLKKKDSIL